MWPWISKFIKLQPTKKHTKSDHPNKIACHPLREIAWLGIKISRKQGEVGVERRVFIKWINVLEHKITCYLCKMYWQTFSSQILVNTVSIYRSMNFYT
jgi:hypothetical protein